MASKSSAPSQLGSARDWRGLALDLPRFHPALVAGQTHGFDRALAALPALTAENLARMADDEALLAGLDVLMVEAVVRRHRLERDGSALDASARAVAERLGLQPIISYPLYIRENPSDLAEIRRFTDLDAEFRFIRMHAAIEDIFDGLIRRLDAILAESEPRTALREQFAAIAAGLRSANRIMSGFRSPQRMPKADFFDGFRPYYSSLHDGDTGELILEGPSGLQSFTYRIIAMMIGYQDRVLDGWTRRIGHYHPPAVRERLDQVLAARDGGRSLDGQICQPILGPAAALPHLHPAYGAHLQHLVPLARRGGYIAPDVLGLLADFGLALGDWPAEMPPEPEVVRIERPSGLKAEDLSDLALLVELESALVGMHLEHAATAAYQIGAVRGTGGTSGVEFLLVATFRRAFPALWQCGLGVQIAAVA